MNKNKKRATAQDTDSQIGGNQPRGLPWLTEGFFVSKFKKIKEINQK
jgi:hypothetical protein